MCYSSRTINGFTEKKLCYVLEQPVHKLLKLGVVLPHPNITMILRAVTAKKNNSFSFVASFRTKLSTYRGQTNATYS